ncbi:hypothetical protein FACS189494_09760 [Spirochaetia bacterium]|nr:hypothetical protein FACS189494_09760 [Spirochaetia bacterium]
MLYGNNNFLKIKICVKLTRFYRNFCYFLIFLITPATFAPCESVVGIAGAVNEAADYLSKRIPEKSKVVVFNFTAKNQELSDYISDTLTAALVNGTSFTVVDRRNLEMLHQELKFQMSGEVDEATAQAIGKKLGAQSIISGSIEPLGNLYRLQVQAIEVSTAKIQAMRNYNIENDPLIAAIIGKRRTLFDTARDIMFLDKVIKTTSAYLHSRIESGMKVVVLNWTSENATLSNYIIDELTALLVNDGSLIIVDRKNLELLQREMDFQLSGEISDETAQAVGKKLGAQSIISGYILPVADMFRFNVRAIEVESAKIQALQNNLVKQDIISNALTGKTKASDFSSGFTVGLRFGGSMHLYDSVNSALGKPDGSVSIDVAPQISWRFNKLLAIQTEFIFTADALKFPEQQRIKVIDESGRTIYFYDTKYSFNSVSLLMPLLLKVQFYPSNFYFSLQGGIYGSFMLGDIELFDSFNGNSKKGNAQVQFGFSGGLMTGILLGPGVLFIDARYMGDLGKTKFSSDNKNFDMYHRNMILFSIGYDFYFKR